MAKEPADARLTDRSDISERKRAAPLARMTPTNLDCLAESYRFNASPAFAYDEANFFLGPPRRRTAFHSSGREGSDRRSVGR